MLAFFLIAAVLLLLFHILLKATGVIQKLIDLTLILTLPSKILGFVVGIISGYLYIFIALVILSVPLGGVDLFTNSSVVNHILQDSPILSNSLGGFKHAVADIYELTEKTVTSEDINTNQMNLEVMDILLKYEVVSSEEMNDFMNHTDKLDNIKGLEDIIYKYQ